VSKSKFWRTRIGLLTCADEIPADLQELATAVTSRLHVGQGLIVAELDEISGCAYVNWVGVIESISKPGQTVSVVWRNADFVLKPTASGRVYWKKLEWFNFVEEVAERYMLDALFADIFDEDLWSLTKTRKKLSVQPNRLLTASETLIDEPNLMLGGISNTSASPNPTVGYVYLIWSKHGYKIGKAINVRNRTRLFEVKLPFPIEVEHYARFDDYTHAERSLHLHFDHKRLEGEWFALNDEDIAFIKTLGESQPTSTL